MNLARIKYFYYAIYTNYMFIYVDDPYHGNAV